MLQPIALQTFTALSVLSPSWAGRLVIALGLDESGAALAIATNIAGGVSLSIDADAARMREAVRGGTVDFLVSSFDEALRAIKNELRKKTPLSVALHADPNVVLEDALERGLAPQLFSRFGGLGTHDLLERSTVEFASLDADLVDFESLSGVSLPDGHLGLDANDLIAPLLKGKRWSMATFASETPARLRNLDMLALEIFPVEDRMRRHWVESIPRILQRQRPPVRALWLTPEERGVFEQQGFTPFST